MIISVKRLNPNHSAALYALLVKNREVGGLQFVSTRDLYLSTANGLAIACTEDNEIKQVLLCQFENDYAVTRALLGEMGSYTPVLFDTLCANCSSRTPLVENHLITVQTKLYPEFHSSFMRSRLGKYLAEQSYQSDENWTTFKAKVVYPS